MDASCAGRCESANLQRAVFARDASKTTSNLNTVTVFVRPRGVLGAHAQVHPGGPRGREHGRGGPRRLRGHQSYVSKGIRRQGTGALCKEFLCFNTMHALSSYALTCALLKGARGRGLLEQVAFSACRSLPARRPPPPQSHARRCTWCLAFCIGSSKLLRSCVANEMSLLQLWGRPNVARVLSGSANAPLGPPAPPPRPRLVGSPARTSSLE